MEKIDTGNLVGVAVAEPPGVEPAHERRPSEIAPEASHRRVGLLRQRAAERALVGGKQQVRGGVAGGKDAERRRRGASHLARELEAGVGIGDGASEHRLDRRGEEIRALQEERTLLGKEQRKPRVHVELGDVRLDLGEVGIPGGIERQVGADAPPEVQAEGGIDVAARERAVGQLGAKVGPGSGKGRVELDVPPGRVPREAGDLVRFAEQACVVAIAGRGLDPMAHTAGIGALQNESPGLYAGCARKPERLERDRDLYGVAQVIDAPGRGPDGVPRPVLEPLGRTEQRIRLAPQRAHAELEPAPLIAERIDDDVEVVVEDEALDVVAAEVAGPDLRGMGIERATADVEAIGVIRNPAHRPHGWRRVVARCPLPFERNLGCAAPSRVVEQAVQPDGPRGGPDRERRRRGQAAPGRDDGRLSGDQHEGSGNEHYAAAAAGAGPASTNCLVTGSIRKLSPSRVRDPSITRSPSSPNTTSSVVRLPATWMNAAPVRRSRTVPADCRKRQVAYRSIPRDSRTPAGTHDSSAPVSTRTDLKVRRSPGRAGFSISMSTRKLPMSSDILPPEVMPSSTTSLRRVSMRDVRHE